MSNVFADANQYGGNSFIFDSSTNYATQGGSTLPSIVTAVSNGTGSAIDITHGLTIAEGEALVMQIWHGTNGALVFTDTDGFTLDFTVGDPGLGARTFILSKIAGASEPLSYNLTTNVGDDWTVVLHKIQNADNNDLYDVDPPATAGVAPGGAVTTIPSITTNTDNALAIMSIGTEQALTSNAITEAGWDEEAATLVDPLIAVASKLITPAGATGTVEVTRNTSVTSAVWGFAIKADPLADVQITDIDGDNQVEAGQENVVITGTNFGTVSAVTLGGEALILV